MNPIALLNSLPGAVSQGLIWGIMAIGVYLTYKILDVADLTVDGTMCTGGAVFIMLTMAGWSIPAALLASFLAGMLAGLATGLLHTACGIPAILSGILTQLALYSFSDSNDLAAVTESAVAASDVIYVPTDNTVAANTGIIDNICRPAGIPVVTGEEGIAAGCGVATLSISYYDIGYKTGEMAAQVLTGEADISTMPIEYAPQFTKKYNAEICADLGVTIPSDYVAIE